VLDILGTRRPDRCAAQWLNNAAGEQEPPWRKNAVDIQGSRNAGADASLPKACPALLTEEIRRTVSVGDFIAFRQGDDYVIGEIIEAGPHEVTCHEFAHMTTDIIGQFSLQPLTQSLYPVSSQLALTELVGTSSVVVMDWLEIVDLIFVISVGEVESGIVHMTGASNLYVIRYEVIDGTQINNYAPSYYFFMSNVSAVECPIIFGFELFGT
jgi:hypothetical protein